MKDIAMGVKNEFGVNITEGLGDLDGLITLSKEAYDCALNKFNKEDAFKDLVACKPFEYDGELLQCEKDLEKLFKEAQEAQGVLRAEWDKDGGAFKVDDPGVKSRERAKEKLEKEYDGNVGRLKDLARLSLTFQTCDGLLRGRERLRGIKGWEVRRLKNRFASPTPLG